MEVPSFISRRHVKSGSNRVAVILDESLHYSQTRKVLSMKSAAWLFAILIFPSSVFAQAIYPILAEDAAGLWGQADGTGAGNDIVRAAFEAMGDKVTFSVVPYNRCKAQVMEGHSLACFGMGWSEELKGKVVFAKHPIYTNTATLFVRKADAEKFRKVGDIADGTRIGTVLGYEYPETFVQLVRSGKLVPDNAINETLSLRKLAAGRFDLVIANLDDLKSAEYLLKQAGMTDRVQVAFTMESAGTFLGFAGGDTHSAVAMKSFDAGMVLIQKNGTLAKILASWKARL
jgi:polar amino acid transport system substrate-binding protein